MLTRREVEVLERVANGESNKTIARELFIGEQTVKNYLWSIYGKVGIPNWASARVWITLHADEIVEGEHG